MVWWANPDSRICCRLRKILPLFRPEFLSPDTAEALAAVTVFADGEGLHERYLALTGRPST